MDNTTFLFLCLLIVSSIVTHTFMRHILFASVISGVGSTSIFEAISPPDALWIIGFVLASVFGCLISMIIGLIINSVRKKRL